MKKTFLISMLLISLVFEAYLTGLAFIDPPGTLKLFKIAYDKDTAMLAYFIGWFLLLISSICVYMIRLVIKDRGGYFGMINLLALWWIGIGVGVYLSFGRSANLVTDSSKGLILLCVNLWYAKSKTTAK